MQETPTATHPPPNPLDNTTARRIREAAGWSRQRMADELGVHVQTLIRWELGSNVPSGRRLWAYAAVLSELDSLRREASG